MEKLHTLLLLLSCQKTNDRRDACRETWLRRPLPSGMKAVFLVGRPGEHPSLAGDVLYLDCPDTYLALPQKVWAGIREAFNRWDFDWIFKADDDTWVNPLRVLNYPKSNDYIGRKSGIKGHFDLDWHAGKDLYAKDAAALRQSVKEANMPAEHTPWRGCWANGGVGYFLSRHAAQLVADEPLTHVKMDLYEDKFVGDVMISHNIQLHGEHQTLRGREDSHYGATTIHPLKVDQMRHMYWKLLRAGEIGT